MSKLITYIPLSSVERIELRVTKLPQDALSGQG